MKHYHRIMELARAFVYCKKKNLCHSNKRCGILPTLSNIYLWIMSVSQANNLGHLREDSLPVNNWLQKIKITAQLPSTYQALALTLGTVGTGHSLHACLYSQHPIGRAEGSEVQGDSRLCKTLPETIGSGETPPLSLRKVIVSCAEWAGDSHTVTEQTRGRSTFLALLSLHWLYFEHDRPSWRRANHK